MSKKIAIVTGASSGIGKHIAQGVPDLMNVDEIWAIARNEQRLRELALPVPVRPLSLDLTKQESLNAIAALLEEERPDVRLLVNAGGFGKFERFDRTTLRDAADMVDLNCRALTLLTHIALPYCERGSVICNIASVAAFQPVPFAAEYGASKAYVLSLSRSMNRELRPRGIKVIAICPYWTKTAFFDRANPEGIFTHFDCMYAPSFIAKKTLKAIGKKKDYVVPGFIAKATHAMTKLLPHSLVMSVFLSQQNLKNK